MKKSSAIVALCGGLVAILSLGAQQADKPMQTSSSAAASAKPETRAQQMVDEVLATHPEIKMLVVRVRPPGSGTYVVVASNIGRYGSPAGKDDMRVIATGQTSYEEELAKGIFEVEPALRDHEGHILGSLSVVFYFKKDQDKDPLVRIANEVNAAFTVHLPDSASFFGPPTPSR